MKPRFHSLRQFHSLFASIGVIATASHTGAATATWDGAPDGGGSSADGNWSTATNWVGDAAPGTTGDNLIFDGTTNLTAANDIVTALATTGTALTFQSTAGSFNLSGNEITVGSGAGGGQTIIQQSSPSAQTISANLKLSGGNGDRSIVFAAGAGSLTLSGNINFSNDWLFPTSTAGTIILSGTNTGDGKATNAITAGSNILRAMMRNNVANTQLVLGNSHALGNPNVDYANRRGVIANQSLYLACNADLTGANAVQSTFSINNNWIDFNSTNNLEIGGLINQGGNRDFKVSNSGSITVAGFGIDLSNDQTARQLYLQLKGAGAMTVNGSINDTFHSGGIATTVNDIAGRPTRSIFRKSGPGTLTLNGDSGTSFHGDFRIEYNASLGASGGKVILGHDNALGPASSTTLAATTTASVYQDFDYVEVADVTGIAPGQTVVGDGIPEGTTVVSVDEGFLTVYLSTTATADLSGSPISFHSTMTHLVSVNSGCTLDLNGHTLDKRFNTLDGAGSDGNGGLINSNSSTPATLTQNVPGVGNLTIGGAGDITAPRLIGGTTRTITKKGAGTFTTNGDGHNNLCGWVIEGGTVVFANTSGYGSDRGTTINGGTLRLAGTNPNLINNSELFTLNSGTFDLNGKTEAIAGLDGTGGVITNSNSSQATLYIGGSTGGTANGSYAGVIQDGTGVLKLTKEGSGTQTLTGACTYTGDTTVVNGTLSVSNPSFDDNSNVVVHFDDNGAVLDLTHSDTDVVASLDLGSGPLADGIYNAGNTGGAITGTGSLQVVTPSAGGYTTWADDNGASGQTPDQDHDKDGTPNGVEYFMGETGSTFTSNPSVVAGSITWLKDPDFAGSYTVQTSTDLVNWSNVSSTDNGNSVTYTLPAGQTKIFVRLDVTPD